MVQSSLPRPEKFDKTNAFVAGLVLLISFIVYALTVQKSIPFWDCGEFIACAYILGIPHPPGTPLFMLIGRIFSIIPFVEDISYRINYISVISSAITAMFSYLLTVRIVGYFFGDEKDQPLNRLIAYVGGFAGGLFVAFSRTNWSNAVEAEVYGLALALTVMIVWLTVKYFEDRGTVRASRDMILVFYLALLGVGLHMTVFIIVPVIAIFYIIKREATPRDWAMVCGFIMAELLLIFLLAGTDVDINERSRLFFLLSGILGLVLVAMLFRKINWALLLAIASACSVMVGFELYLKITALSFVLMIILGLLSHKYKWNIHWKTGLAILFVGVLGMSVHLYIPIRSTLKPRIDENGPARGWPNDWRQFINFLDRKQYGQTSMLDRMFDRRGKWENQFGRHANMGFWSYFEDQYSRGGWVFIAIFFALGLLGMIVAIQKRLEIGLPFFTLFIVCSVGLVLYMNFADGTQYDFRTGDAYQEVRNRDYFFTPTFVFFGIAIGMGVSALMVIIRNRLVSISEKLANNSVYATALLGLLPVVSLAHSYHANDRSKNFIPYIYAANILDTCEPNAILFTSGDNDTFPLWAIQEVYDYRKDVRVVNLSLLNTDWYVEQMKNRYDVPIMLEDDQILWNEYEVQPGVTTLRPEKKFFDKPRGRQTYLQADRYQGGIVKVQDMMVDHIVLENKWEAPIFFSSPPYGESPLKLRDRSTALGVIYRLDRNPPDNLVDVESGYNLFMNEYEYDGYQDRTVYRDENATGVFVTMGVNATRIYDELMRTGDTTRAIGVLEKLMKVYPEYWQSALILSALHDRNGDSAKADSVMQLVHDTLSSFLESNPENIFYRQDLGLLKVELGRRKADDAVVEKGIALLWEAFEANPNSTFSFRKLVAVLQQRRLFQEMQRAALKHAEYKRNLEDSFVRQILGATGVEVQPIGGP